MIRKKDTNFDRVKSVTDYVKRSSVNDAANFFGIKKKTVRNYMALMKLYEENFTEKKPSPKILVLDIETAPIIGSSWGVWQQNIQPVQIIHDWFILTWAAKWLNDDYVFSDAVTVDEVVKRDDRRLVGGMWDLLNDADIVIGHNSNRFDLKKLNTRFIVNGYVQPSPYQMVDTLLGARNAFSFSHNKLDYLTKMFSLDQKIQNSGMELWNKCVAGDEDAIKEMLVYNENDVVITEQLYLEVRAWIKPHPNVGLYYNDNVSRCHICGSDELIDSGKTYNTSVNRYPVYQCEVCGAYSRGRSSVVKGKDRDNLLSPTAR